MLLLCHFLCITCWRPCWFFCHGERKRCQWHFYLIQSAAREFKTKHGSWRKPQVAVNHPYHISSLPLSLCSTSEQRFKKEQQGQSSRRCSTLAWVHPKQAVACGAGASWRDCSSHQSSRKTVIRKDQWKKWVRRGPKEPTTPWPQTPALLVTSQRWQMVLLTRQKMSKQGGKRCLVGSWAIESERRGVFPNCLNIYHVCFPIPKLVIICFKLNSPRPFFKFFIFICIFPVTVIGDWFWPMSFLTLVLPNFSPVLLGKGSECVALWVLGC